MPAGITRNGDGDGDVFGPHGDGGCPHLTNGDGGEGWGPRPMGTREIPI